MKCSVYTLDHAHGQTQSTRKKQRTNPNLLALLQHWQCQEGQPCWQQASTPSGTHYSCCSGECFSAACSMFPCMVFTCIGSPPSCHRCVLCFSLPGLLAAPGPLETLEAPTAGAAKCNDINTSPSHCHSALRANTVLAILLLASLHLRQSQRCNLQDPGSSDLFMAAIEYSHSKKRMEELLILNWRIFYEYFLYNIHALHWSV